MGKFDSEKVVKLKKIDKLIEAIYFNPKNKLTYPPIIKEEVREIIIMGMMMIGDTVMCIPALKVLRANFPNAHITLVCGDPVKTILINENLVDTFFLVKCPWVVKSYSFKVMTGFMLDLFRINKKRYDLAIDFRGDWRNMFYMNFIKARRKASFNYTGGEYMLTDVIVPNPSIDHYSNEWLYLLEQLGCNVLPAQKIPELHLSAANKSYVDDFMNKYSLKKNMVIGVHPGASQEVKKWDETKYAELITRIHTDYPDAKFILFEGPNERGTVRKIEDLLLAAGISYILVNKKLNEYMVLLSICDLMICNDSGAAHIAAAFGISVLMMFGNVDPKYVTPQGAKMIKVISHNLDCKPCHKSFCKFGTNACIKEIETNEVYTSASEILNILQMERNGYAV